MNKKHLHYMILMLEVGTYDDQVEIINAESSVASVQVPDDAVGKSIHMICEVTDEGEPALTSYHRSIFDVK